jgi:hypothetical protein
MTTLFRSALVIVAILSSASAAMATPRGSQFVDESKPHGGYAPNSPEGARAFWDYQSRHGN